MKTAVYFGWREEPLSRVVEAILQESFELKLSRETAFGEKIDQAEAAALKPDFLFSFGPLIVQKPLLDAVRIAAINFHTAPPRWPGRGSCSFALLESDLEFGVTAHLMVEKLDAGPILKVLRFPIPGEDDCETLSARTLALIPDLVRQTVSDLRANEWQPSLSPEKWARPALRQKEMAERMRIHEVDSVDVINRKIRAFAHSKKPGPFIERQGRLFWYLKGKPNA